MDQEKNYEIDWAAALSKPDFYDKIGQDFPQNQFNVSDEVLSQYYSAAREYLDEENFPGARDTFLFLTFLNPAVSNFWIGLGVAEQSQGAYQKAVDAYKMGEIVDPDNPTIHANSCQCYMALKDDAKADESFEKSMTACGDKPEHKEIKTAIKEFKESFKTSKK
jgi:type III secretion system low calcium response chaperone LcrH/SycD